MKAYMEPFRWEQIISNHHTHPQQTLKKLTRFHHPLETTEKQPLISNTSRRWWQRQRYCQPRPWQDAKVRYSNSNSNCATNSSWSNRVVCLLSVLSNPQQLKNVVGSEHRRRLLSIKRKMMSFLIQVEPSLISLQKIRRRGQTSRKLQQVYQNLQLQQLKRKNEGERQKRATLKMLRLSLTNLSRSTALIRQAC